MIGRKGLGSGFGRRKAISDGGLEILARGDGNLETRAAILMKGVWWLHFLM